VNLSGLIADYGYVALFAGSLLEGETFLILAIGGAGFLGVASPDFQKVMSPQAQALL